MEFEKFKKHIDSILSTRQKEEEISKCIETYLSRTTYCIVDICDEVVVSLIDLLADYYNCHFEIQGVKDNEISWWLYADTRKIFTKDKSGKKVEIDVSTLEEFWKYLEDNKKNQEASKGE